MIVVVSPRAVPLSGKVLMSEDDSRGRALDLASPEPRAAQEEALLGQLSKVRSNLDRERAEAPELVSELLARPAEQWEGVITDISGSGMRVLAGRSVPPHATMRLTADGLVMTGEVCYCEVQGDGFAIGLEIKGAHWQQS